MKLDKKYRELLRKYSECVVLEESLLTTREKYKFRLKELYNVTSELLNYMDKKHKNAARTFTPITIVAIDSYKVRMKKGQS